MIEAACRGSVFFFQAEDGIRDGHVTGVQTCALPISTPASACTCGCWPAGTRTTSPRHSSRHWPGRCAPPRSEERRVGKERSCRGAPCQEQRNTGYVL